MLEPKSRLRLAGNLDVQKTESTLFCRLNPRATLIASPQTLASSECKTFRHLPSTRFVMSDQEPELSITAGDASETGFTMFVEGQNDDRTRRDILVARCGTVRLAVFADEVEGVMEWREPTPLPHAPKAILGITSSRGRILTLIDPTRILEAGNNQPFERDFIISLRSDEQLALAVEKVERILEIVVETIVMPTSDSKHEPHAVGTISLDTGSILVLNTAELFNAAMRRDGSSGDRL
jgi:purine-binding chemotaxis protein CheW